MRHTAPLQPAPADAVREHPQPDESAASVTAIGGRQQALGPNAPSTLARSHGSAAARRRCSVSGFWRQRCVGCVKYRVQRGAHDVCCFLLSLTAPVRRAVDTALLEPLPPSWEDVDYDIVVVGAGPSGLACAHAATMVRTDPHGRTASSCTAEALRGHAQNGARCLVVDARPSVSEKARRDRCASFPLRLTPACVARRAGCRTPNALAFGHEASRF